MFAISANAFIPVCAQILLIICCWYETAEFSKAALISRHKLLSVYDPKVWSIGVVSGTPEVYRRDIIFIVNGRAQNMPICPYTESKGLVCLYDDVEQGRSPSFEHLAFSRTATSTKRTFLLEACGQVELQVGDVCIDMPEEDTTLRVRPEYTYRHCVFQTDMTRYSSENCSCQVSCASGYMHFAHCRFVKARPMIVNPVYSGGFSGFELSYRDCVFDVLPRYNYLVGELRFDDTEASGSLPNLYMRDCAINVLDGTEAGRYYLYHFNNQGNEGLYHNTVGYLSIVSLDNVQVVATGQDVPIWLCNKKLNYRKDMLRRVVDSSCDSIAYPSGF